MLVTKTFPLSRPFRIARGAPGGELDENIYRSFSDDSGADMQWDRPAHGGSE